MTDKKDCWWYNQPWIPGMNPYEDNKIKITMSYSFWNQKAHLKNSFGPCVKSSYFPFIHKNKELILVNII